MCLHIDKKETTKLRDTHPRVLKWKKQLMITPYNTVVSSIRFLPWENPGWTKAKGDENLFGLICHGLDSHTFTKLDFTMQDMPKDDIRYHIRGGFIHVYHLDAIPHLKQTIDDKYVILPAYGLKDDFIAVGKDDFDSPVACYKKIYIPKAAWRKTVESHPLMKEKIQDEHN